MTQVSQLDKRIQKTLTSLREAFFELVLTYSYDEIKVADIIAKANVGRSTFYQHYKSKDEMLAASMDYPLSVMAESVSDKQSFETLYSLMEHFWQNRKFAPRIFAGTSRRIIIATLAEKLVQQLKILKSGSQQNTAIPLTMAAHQLAEAQMTLTIDWLLGKEKCTTKAISLHLKDSSVMLAKLSLRESKL